MAEAAGLVIGVAALWENCVQIYEVVDSARQYGIEYELLTVKFEVERVRLLCWGDAVGLGGILPDTQPAASAGAAPARPTNDPDVRFSRGDVRDAVYRVLGCIQRVFENINRFQESYSLEVDGSTPAEGEISAALTHKQRVLAGVFKRAYNSFRRVAQDRQQNTTLKRKTLWAVRDGKKFGVFVAELRGFNDSLESLFPDAQTKIAEAMRIDIGSAVEMRDLQLLHEAMAEDHEQLSEQASVRLEALGATVSARTELLQEAIDDNSSQKSEETEAVTRESVVDGVEIRVAALKSAPEVDELTKRLIYMELYMEEKVAGALDANLVGPFPELVRVFGQVYWSGRSHNSSYSDEKSKGFVPTIHVSFDMYKKKEYMSKRPRDRFATLDAEEHLLFDPESHTKYENINPGTVTVEGYGLECWEFEETKPREVSIMVNHSNLPVLPVRRILRLLDDLQWKNRSKFGWNTTKEKLDLKELVGTLGIVYYDTKYAIEPDCWIGDLYSVLNRSDIFVDFTATSSVWLQMVGRGNSESHIGVWGFLRQIILGWELAVRLKDDYKDSSSIGFTSRMLATLILSELWIKNVEIVLRDTKTLFGDAKRPETEDEKRKAEEFNTNGDEALTKEDYQNAVALYTEAMKMDNANAIYYSNRSAAFIGLNKYEAAEDDAYVATMVDPFYALAWMLLGLAVLKIGHPKRAKKAYEKALEIAGNDATATIQQGLRLAEEEIARLTTAINAETNDEKRHQMRSDFVDQDWESFGKTVEFHSVIHEQQVEGLLLFAERIKWPYINELRDCAEDMYSNLRGGETLDVDLHDWLYGLTLPGKWFSFKIMTALVLCTPSIRDVTGISSYYECGLALPTSSYWRLRTALGRVLGCLPGVISMCGWIGPCPPVQFEQSAQNDKPRHVRIKARRIALSKYGATFNDGVPYISDDVHDRHYGIRMRPTEEVEPYLAEMCEPSNWIVPQPPVRDISTCEIKTIQLKQLALEIGVSRQAAKGELGDLEVELHRQYRASITFTIDNNQSPVTYKLFTNPVFVTPPPCHQGPNGPHPCTCESCSNSKTTYGQLSS